MNNASPASMFDLHRNQTEVVYTLYTTHREPHKSRHTTTTLAGFPLIQVRRTLQGDKTTRAVSCPVTLAEERKQLLGHRFEEIRSAHAENREPSMTISGHKEEIPIWTRW